jgi:hemerythrin-like metal-binding protein
MYGHNETDDMKEECMPFLEWDVTLSVNIDEIDQQHKNLFGMINVLHDSINSNDRTKIVSEILIKLKDYFNVHFGTEEKYMDMYDYPSSSDHKSEHKKFIKEILDLESACYSGYTPYIPVLDFLKDWLNQHIKMTDIQLGIFLAAHIEP